MDLQKQIQNIKCALSDYHKYTPPHANFDNIISQKTIKYIAKHNLENKNELRSLFKNHPNYDQDLDAIILKVQTDLAKIQITDAIYDLFDNMISPHAIQKITHEILNAKSKKPTRILRERAISYGVYTEEKHSRFQKIYAHICDLLTRPNKKQTLFVSLNPAHILTMSNPKEDNRGTTLTSCHSINYVQDMFNSACTALAMDASTFIVFQVKDPNNKESLNNRKTMRQLYHYDTKSTLLLQNRLYSSYAIADMEKSMTYYGNIIRELIKDLTGLQSREWFIDKQLAGHVSDYYYTDTIVIPDQYKGYKDWEIGGNQCTLSKLNLTNATLTIAQEHSICLHCAEVTNIGILCETCLFAFFQEEVCDSCGDYFMCKHEYIDDVHYHEDIGYLCKECMDNMVKKDNGHKDINEEDTSDNYENCYMCGQIKSKNELNAIGHSALVCNDCLDNISICDECSEYISPGEEQGDSEHTYCPYCFENFQSSGICDTCGKECAKTDRTYIYENAEMVCEKCKNEGYTHCDLCQMLSKKDSAAQIGNFTYCKTCMETK